MRPVSALGCTVLIAGMAACGTEPATEPVSAPRTQVTATVLESGSHGPSLCLGAVLTSYPPQCGTLPITNWSWDDAENEETVGPITWGDYHVVGTFDGTSFTLTEPPGPPRPFPPSDPQRFDSPCPEPEGGWKPVDPARTTQEAMKEAGRIAAEAPEYAGRWLDDRARAGRTGRDDETAHQDPKDVVLNLVFTENLAKHERRAREVWGGALCVSKARYTAAELETVADRLIDEVRRDFGLMPLSSGMDPIENHVGLEVVWIDDETRRALEERYGPGAIEVTTALRPV